MAFTLADGANRYLLNSLMYTGPRTLQHADAAYQSLPQPARIVTDLMSQYLEKGYHLFTDRYMTKIANFMELCVCVCVCLSVSVTHT